MKVTDLDYALEKLKVSTLNYLCSRVSGHRKFQNVIATDGMEGYGKSTITAADAYYMAYTMRRPLKLFFDIDALNNYSISSKEEILIWDDVALAGLSLEHYNQQILKLIKILLLARKKRHTYFLNIQEVFRMKEPLVARVIGMNHVYSPDGLELGRYTYHDEKEVRLLYSMWQTRKRKSYKYYLFKGSFPDVLYKVFDENVYEELKDRAIQSIQVTKKKSKKELKLADFQFKIASNAISKGKVKEACSYLGVGQATLYGWANKVLIEGDAPISELQPGDKYIIGDYIEPKSKTYLSLPKEKVLLVPTSRIIAPPKLIY